MVPSFHASCQRVEQLTTLSIADWVFKRISRVLTIHIETASGLLVLNIILIEDLMISQPCFEMCESGNRNALGTPLLTVF